MSTHVEDDDLWDDFASSSLAAVPITNGTGNGLQHSTNPIDSTTRSGDLMSAEDEAEFAAFVSDTQSSSLGPELSATITDLHTNIKKPIDSAATAAFSIGDDDDEDHTDTHNADADEDDDAFGEFASNGTVTATTNGQDLITQPVDQPTQPAEGPAAAAAPATAHPISSSLTSQQSDDADALPKNLRVEQVEDPVAVVYKIVLECTMDQLKQCYDLTHDFEDADQFIFQVAQKRGKLLKGVPDVEAACRIIIQDWNNGEIAKSINTQTAQSIATTNSFTIGAEDAVDADEQAEDRDDDSFGDFLSHATPSTLANGTEESAAAVVTTAASPPIDAPISAAATAAARINAVENEDEDSFGDFSSNTIPTSNEPVAMAATSDLSSSPSDHSPSNLSSTIVTESSLEVPSSSLNTISQSLVASVDPSAADVVEVSSVAAPPVELDPFAAMDEAEEQEEFQRALAAVTSPQQAKSTTAAHVDSAPSPAIDPDAVDDLTIPPPKHTSSEEESYPDPDADITNTNTHSLTESLPTNDTPTPVESSLAATTAADVEATVPDAAVDEDFSDFNPSTVAETTTQPANTSSPLDSVSQPTESASTTTAVSTTMDEEETEEDFGAFESPAAAAPTATATTISDETLNSSANVEPVSEPITEPEPAVVEDDEEFGDFAPASSSMTTTTILSSTADVAVTESFIDPDGDDEEAQFTSFSTTTTTELTETSSNSLAATESTASQGDVASGPAAAAPTSITQEAILPAGEEEDDFGDFSSRTAFTSSTTAVVASSVESTSTIVAPPPPVAADFAASFDEDEEFADFASGPIAPAPSVQPAVASTVTTTTGADDNGEDEEEAWGDFDSSSNTAASTIPALPVAPPPAAVPAPAPTTAADIFGSGAVADAIQLWKLPPHELSQKLDAQISTIFGAFQRTTTTVPVILQNTVQDKGPYLRSDKFDPCSVCGAAAFPRPTSSTINVPSPSLCIYCGKSVSPHLNHLTSLLPPITPFKGSIIYTNLFDALGVAPPALAPISPPNADSQLSSQSGYIDSSSGVGVSGSQHGGLPGSTPSPNPIQSSSPMDDGGNKTTVDFDMDFFSSAKSTAASTTTTSTQASHLHVSNSDTHLQSSQSHRTPTHQPSNELDSLDWLNAAAAPTTISSSSQPTTITSTTHPHTRGGDAEDDDEEFADFSSAPPVISTTTTTISPPINSSNVSIQLNAFTVTKAKPTRGELSLKRLQELVNGLPDLAFLAQ